MKKILILLTLIFLAQNTLAIELNELSEAKKPSYRVGTTDSLEEEYKVKETLKTSIVKNEKYSTDIEKLTYADLSIKKISNEIGQSLEIDAQDMMGDLSILWQGAATQSDTIKFALYKLSNPDTDKPDEKSLKKVLSTIANMSTLVGAGMGNPLLSTGAFMSGSLLGIMSQDTKALNYKYTKINDTDMIILVKKIDDLQQNIVNRYYDYITTKKTLDNIIKITAKRYENYKLAQTSSREMILISDAYYRESLDMQMKARNDFYAKRAAMEQLVGKDAFKQFELNIKSRN